MTFIDLLLAETIERVSTWVVAVVVVVAQRDCLPMLVHMPQE